MFGLFKKAEEAADEIKSRAKTIDEAAQTIEETAETIEETANIIKIAEYVKIGIGAIGLILLGVIAYNTSK